MWPITSTTFITVGAEEPEQGAEVLKFVFRLGLQNGAKQANDLDYASLPDASLSRFVPLEDQYKDSNGKGAVLVRWVADGATLVSALRFDRRPTL